MAKEATLAVKHPQKQNDEQTSKQISMRIDNSPNELEPISLLYTISIHTLPKTQGSRSSYISNDLPLKRLTTR
jgi:hypothetical protein